MLKWFRVELRSCLKQYFTAHRNNIDKQIHQLFCLHNLAVDPKKNNLRCQALPSAIKATIEKLGKIYIYSTIRAAFVVTKMLMKRKRQYFPAE